MNMTTEDLLVQEIGELKKKTGAFILAHNYIHSRIFRELADITGDSLALARNAAELDVGLIVVCGVTFMAETVKLLNPDSKVLNPAPQSGCSLADSISAEELRAFKAKHPGCKVMTYINTTAEIKAESDICCTSGNALSLVSALPDNEILFIPDRFLAANIQGTLNERGSGKTLISWRGACEVHEQVSSVWLEEMKIKYPRAKILSHPECPPEICLESHFSGSTREMIDYISKHNPEEVILVTEKHMTGNIAPLFPSVNFIPVPFSCRHMKLVSLEALRNCLRDGSGEVFIDAALQKNALLSLKEMLQPERGSVWNT